MTICDIRGVHDLVNSISLWSVQISFVAQYSRYLISPSGAAISTVSLESGWLADGAILIISLRTNRTIHSISKWCRWTEKPHDWWKGCTYGSRSFHFWTISPRSFLRRATAFTDIHESLAWSYTTSLSALATWFKDYYFALNYCSSTLIVWQIQIEWRILLCPMFRFHSQMPIHFPLQSQQLFVSLQWKYP